MSEKLKVLSSSDVIKIFLKYGCVIKRTIGSHTRISYTSDLGNRYVTVPLHRELKK
jgi:predicted RNA binding protein YcfA (HicA-like mRNA interferase family)